MGNRQNVTTGKPKVAGAVFWADPATTIPTDATTALDAAFEDLGYCGEEGLKNTQSKSAKEIKAWGGDVVDTVDTEHKDIYELTLIEALNIEVIKAARGSTNVSGDLATGITVKANNKERDLKAWIVDMIGKGTVIRHVLLYAKVIEVGEVVYTEGGAVGYKIKLAAYPNSAGDTHYEYIKSTS